MPQNAGKPDDSKHRIVCVVHHHDDALSIEQCALALAAGADVAMLISHDGRDEELADLAATLAVVHGRERVGFNLLTFPVDAACRRAVEAGVGHVWSDDSGITSAGVAAKGLDAHLYLRSLGPVAPTHYAGIAFKHQAHEADPGRAAKYARDLGFVPTTSGAATGVAPPLAKIEGIATALRNGAAIGGLAPEAPHRLAIASGLDADNVGAFCPHATDFLVASSVALDEHRIDRAKLVRFIEKVRWGGAPRRSFIARIEHALHDNGPITEVIEADDEAGARRIVESSGLFRVVEIEEDVG